MASRMTVAAVRSGTDPVGQLPEGSFHRWLETQVVCPKCDATYNLVVAWDDAISRFFEEESRAPIRMLKRAIQMGHASGHRVTHFESAGVIVRRFVVEEKAKSELAENR